MKYEIWNICICHDRSRDAGRNLRVKVSRGNINPKNSGRDTRDTGLRGERKGWISVGWITRKKESFLLNDLSRKAREGSISKARPFPRVRSSAQTSVFQDEKIFPYFIRENWYSKHEDEDVVKKKKKSLFSFSHETSIVCPSCNENFPHDNFLLLLLLLLWILRSRHVFWEYLLFTDVLLERWKFLLQSSFGDFTLCLIFLLDWKWMVNDFLQFLFCR